MKQCIIHIGMHKTGTTSIQKSLHGFSDASHLYAGLWHQPNHSVALECCFSPDRAGRKHPEPFIAKNAASAFGAFKRIQREIGDRTLILSGEGVSKFSEPAIRAMREFLIRDFGQFTIAAYVRPPAAYASSAFQQKVKSGRTPPLTSYREYRESFEKFDSIFGSENVRLWKFDPASFPDGCVVRDICQRLEIPLSAERIRNSNESMSRQAISLLYTYAKYCGQIGTAPFKAPLSWAIYPALLQLGNDKLRISPDVVRPVLDQNRADIAWMEERLGCSLNEDLGEHSEGDIRSETDLIEQAVAMAEPLRTIVEKVTRSGIQVANSPEGVAQMIYELARSYSDNRMNIKSRRLV